MTTTTPMSPAGLLALAAEIAGRPDGSIVFPSGHYVKDVTAEQPVCRTADMARAEESRAIRHLLACQQFADESLNAERFLRRLQREQAEQAAAAERERLDPLTTLEAPRVPAADDDGVFFYRAGGLPFGIEFRRPSDGKRYAYRAPSPPMGTLRQQTPEVACLPAEDTEALMALGHHPVGRGETYDDLLGMLEPWHRARFPDPSARNYYPVIDFAESIAKSSDECMMSGEGAPVPRWGRFARRSELPGRADLAETIRRHLSAFGFLEGMISFAEMDQPSSFAAGMTKHYPPDPLPVSTMATREWAETGRR